MRRLTRAEYTATVRDLTGVSDDVADAFPSEEIVRGFENNAAALTFPPVLAEKALAAAEALGARVAGGLAGKLPCASNAADAACARAFIGDFGRRAWRRPLAPDEIARFEKLFAMGSVQDGFGRGVQMVTASLLVSVPFFYRVEIGEGPPNARQPTSWEMASRLSYLLWGTMPDDALFAAAEKDQLRTREAIRAQAERMLASPRAREAVATFHHSWLGLDEAPTINKDPKMFPAFTPEVRAALVDETHAFLHEVAWGGQSGSLWDLFTGRFTFVNATLAKYYGVAGRSGADFQRAEPDGERRAGILTQATLLAIHSGFDQTSPVLRGKMVRERFLCGLLPVPPPTVAATASPPSSTRTTRERAAQHAADPSCSGCHRLMDPIGFGFEGWDPAGRPRAMEAGQPVDDGGEVLDADVGAFRGLAELGRKLAASADARACFVRQWFRFGYGRLEGAADAATLAALDTALRGSNGRYRELLLALTQTAAFLSFGGGR
jgi:hypothetical protein